MPHPGIEPGGDRLEGGGSSVEHAGRRAERESNPPGSCCRRRSSPEIRLGERTAGIVIEPTKSVKCVGAAVTPLQPPASSAWKAGVLPLDDVRVVESARVALASPGCRPGTLLLSYDPAGREGIEPSLRVLEARPVTMTLRPRSSATRIGKEVIAPVSGHASIEAEAFGIEPMYSSPAFAESDP